MRHDCVFLLEVTEKSIPQECDQCGNIETSVWGCKRFDLCAPFVKGTISDPEVTDCNPCNYYRSNGMYCKLVKIGRDTYKCETCGTTVGTEYPKRYVHICSKEFAAEVVEPESEPETNPEYCTLIEVGRSTYKCSKCGQIVGTDSPLRYKGICSSVDTNQSEPELKETLSEVDTKNQLDSEPLES